MKHSIILGLLAVVMMTGMVAPAAHAEESTTTVPVPTLTSAPVATPTATTTVHTGSERIAELLAQLAKLTALFNDLKAKLMGVTTELHELKGDLKEGMTDADIKSIQEALASDPTIYPSGLKTGYFGPMTKEAIKKFQAKNGLEVTGEINAETKAALDTIMAARHKEGHFPMGLLLAPGQHRDEFENRFRTQCGVVNASSTVAAPCMRFKDKYHFEMGDRHGSSTMPWRPMMPGQKMDDKRGKDMHNASSTSGHGDDDSADDENDDDEDDN